MGGPEQIRVGKKYTHNDICFPVRWSSANWIDALQKGDYPEGTVAVGMAKLSCDCRMANYTAILRKAPDSAGFEAVPILTTQTPGDTKGIHPGVSMLGGPVGAAGGVGVLHAGYSGGALPEDPPL